MEGNIVIYSRKSRFTGKGESIGNQTELCREYIKLHFGEEALEETFLYEDEGFSGGNLKRPGFQRMMAFVRKGDCRAIVVYRLDRISRNISDFAGLIEELSALGTAFISIREQFDTGTPMGRAMMYIASVFSQLERETIAERIRDNMRELARTGRWLGGTTPTGYTSEAVSSISLDGKTRKSCQLKLVPEEAKIVWKIYESYEATESLAGTEAELMKAGIRTKNGRSFTRFSIRAILENPVYLTADSDAWEYFDRAGTEVSSPRAAFDGLHGMLAYNRTRQEKGKKTEFLPTAEWIVAVGQHPGLIPGSRWVPVQENLKRNGSGAYRKPRGSENEALLTGLLFCACGSRMYPKLTPRRDAEGKRIYTYICSLKERSRKSLCNRKNANGNLLDREILEKIDPDLEALSVEEKRRKLRTLLKRVVWDGEEAKLEPSGEDSK